MKDLLKYYISLQPFFREKMLPMQYNDDFICPSQGYSIIHWDDEKDALCAQCIIIPRTIDDSSEEARKRSLWGMVDGILGCKKGIVDDRYCCSTSFKRTKSFYYANTPTEAILKALCHQEGVEVE